MRKLIVLLAVLTLAVPLMFYGCSGDDGSTGASGAAGTPGTPGAAGDNGAIGATGQNAVNGPTALLDKDSTECTVCHGPGKIADVAKMHNLFVGSITATVTDVTFGAPVGIQVPVSVFFNVTAKDQSGNPVNLPLTTANTAGTQLQYVRISLAKLVPGTNGDPDQWYDYGPSSTQATGQPFRSPSGLVSLGNGNYRYNVGDNAVTTIGYGDNTAAAAYAPSLRHRVGIIISGLPQNLFSTNTFVPSPVENALLDKVPNGGTAISKNTVTTPGCQNCHFALGKNKLGLSSGAASGDFHGGARFEAELCVLCHNPTLGDPNTAVPGNPGEANLVNLVHKLHSDQAVLGIAEYTEISYPQDLRNCTTCHKGPDQNWKTRPSIEACGACHSGTGFNFDNTAIPGVNFATGVGHGAGNVGGIRVSNIACQTCHTPEAIVGYHATENQTPNNPTLPAGLSAFQYGIDNVTVGADNTTARIRFWIKKDGAFMNLGDNGAVIAQPAGTTGTPSFLYAYAMAQDNVKTPADYNNLGRANGQPRTDNVVGKTIVAKNADNSQFTVVIPAAFPTVNPLDCTVGKATMRAVALQGYFSQGTPAVGRHTAAVIQPVSGDAGRRTLVKSGYVDNVGNPVTDPTKFATAKTVGCLECHEVFEGHGGNRVNNVQVCVTCHNPSLTSSGRTIIVGPTTNPAITSEFGSNPVLYPEVPNNMRELIHGLHAGPFRRVTPFVDIRNRVDGILLTSDEITYPGYLGDCQKCHLPGTYDTVLPANLLLTTAAIAPGSTDNVAIVALRNTVPNPTDLVITPTASACGHCHNAPAAITHFQSSGGGIKVPRNVETIPPVTLAPDVLATP